MQLLNITFSCLFFFSFYQYTAAQADTPLHVSICLQDAESLYHVINALVVVQKLDTVQLPVNSDSLRSNVYTKNRMHANHWYRVLIQKEGYQLLDTTFYLKKTSRSRHKRLGFLIQPLRCYYLQGKVLNAALNLPVSSCIVRIEAIDHSISKRLKTSDGQYVFCGNCATKYRLITEAEGFFSDTSLVELPISACSKQTSSIYALTTALEASYPLRFFKGDTLKLQEQLFEDKTVNLAKAGKYQLSRLIKVMQSYPNLRTTICIQASVYQQKRYNRRLAEQRARFLERYLSQNGIGPGRYLLKCVGLFPSSKRTNQINIWKQ